MNYVNLDSLNNSFVSFKGAPPFDHCVVDDFLSSEILDSILNEFLEYDSPKWFSYDNPIENKKALNDWNAFGPVTYSLFNYLNSPEFITKLSSLYGKKLYADPGLHGGGWHCHGVGGNLNPHFDYSIHPKLNLQRTINIIIYISRELKEEHGGHLGLWAHNPEAGSPGELIKEVAPKFNRAIIFDTTQNSWHGMSRPLTQPEGVLRKSLAIYYLCDPSPDASDRGRALFAPREHQMNDPKIDEIIKLRSGTQTSHKVYKSDSK